MPRLATFFTLYSFLACLVLLKCTAAENVTVKHRFIRNAQTNFFTKDSQAKFITNIGTSLCNDINKSWKSSYSVRRSAFDSKAVIDNLADLLKAEGAADQRFIKALEDLKDDSDFTKVMSDFDQAVKGRKNMLTVAKDTVELEQDSTFPLYDAGLRGGVITGKTSATENDLIRYSGYMSGAGSTPGGFMADFPQTVKDLTEGAMASISYKHDKLAYKLKNGNTVDVLRRDNAAALVNGNIQPELNLRLERTGMKDVSDSVISKSFQNIQSLPGTGEAIEQKKLTQQNFISQKKLGQNRGMLKARKIGDKIASNIGVGVESATTAFTLAQGGIDTVAGADMITRARELRARDQITDSEYNDMLRNGKLRVAQGSFGLAGGMKNVMKFAGERIQAKITAEVGEQAAKDLLGEMKRFGSVVGSAISIGTSITSMAKNAIAASDAAKNGQTGKAIVYGVMAAIDGVTAILDGASLVLDAVFPPLSAIIDVASTILQVFNTILGFIADLVDLRTTEQRVKEEFETYIASDAFKQYVDNMADSYKKRNFDIFFYYVDAEVAGSQADPETLRAEKKKITKCLSERAEQDFENQELRIAIIDATKLGKKLEGRFNDDEILAGFGPDEIYGKEGDDILFGRGGDDSIFGGPGHDYLNGGTGRDVLLGGEGDDVIDCEPGVDTRCEGQQGRDILEISGPALVYDDHHYLRRCFIMAPEWQIINKPPRASPVKGIYLNIGGQNGISLGSAFHGWPGGLNEDIHKPAFVISSSCNMEQDFINFFNRMSTQHVNNADELEDKLLWYMAKKYSKKYFCDGESFYEVTSPTSPMRVVRNAINSISETCAELDTDDRLKPKSSSKSVEALMVFAFRRSFTFDEFVKFSAGQPDDLELISNYIPTTFIGNNKDNVIDVSFGLGDMVYTGEGNNVVSVGSTINEYWYTNKDKISGAARHSGFYKWAKYVVGGSGEDTLIIQYMTPPGTSTGNSFYGQWMLRNTDRSSVNTAPTDSTSVSQFDVKENHVVFLKNIDTVEVHAPPNDEVRPIKIDAQHYDGATRYILDKTTFFKGPISTERGVMVLPRSLRGTNTIEFGENTKSTMSFKYYEDETLVIDTINIHQESEHDDGRVTLKPRGHDVLLKNVMNVVSFSSCKTITGSKEPNMIIAEGGETTINAGEGDDTLVSARGVHTLKGGEGADTFVIQGPVIVDYLTISVNMGRDGTTIRCSTTIYGVWDAAQKELEIDVLKNDHANVLLTAVEIIPGEGDETRNLGTITKDRTNRKLIYSPGSNFNDLHRDTAKVVRIKFTTKGSMATIDEGDYGNKIRFDSAASLEDMTADIENNKLVFKSKANPPQTVFIDEEWGRKLINGVSTNLLDLILDFAYRFSVMLFKTSDQEFTRVDAQSIMNFLYQSLKNYETDLNQDFDTIFDSTGVSSDETTINVGNGANIVLAKTKGITYQLGPKSSGSIIFANGPFRGGSGNIIVKGATQCSDKCHNVVVVGAGSNVVVEVCLGKHDVIVTGAELNDVQFITHGSDSLCLKAQGKTLIGKSWHYSNCRHLFFKKSEKTQILVNCQDILEAKITGGHEFPIIVSHDSDSQNLKLELPFSKQDAEVELFYEYRQGTLWISFRQKDSPKDEHYWRKPYMVIEAGKSRPRSLDARKLVNAITTKFKAGIKLRGYEANTNFDTCTFVKEMLGNVPKSQWEIENCDLDCRELFPPKDNNE